MSEEKVENEEEKTGIQTALLWRSIWSSLSKEEGQVLFCAASYSAQKAISLILMTFLPLAVISAGGSHMLSILVIGVYQIGISLTSLVSGKVFSLIGRRGGYLISVLFFFVGAIFGTVAILFESAITLIVSVISVGMAIGISGTVRFAAMEVSRQDPRSKDNALTAVLTGGILSAVFGPLTAPAFAGLIPEHRFLGCYVVVFVFILIYAWLVGVMIIFPPIETPIPPGQDKSSPAPFEASTPTENYRNKFVLATASSTWSNTYLMLIMSSVLTEMVTDKDFSLLKSSMAVFLCFMGRFILGPFSGSFLQDYGLWTGQVIACICFLVATIVFLAADVVSLAGFIIAMTLTGLGWHFGFAVGNLSLRRIKNKGQREGLQTQAHHDFAVFFTSGLIVLSSSLANPSWHTVLSIATVITILLMITSAVSYYLGFTLTEAEIAKIAGKAEEEREHGTHKEADFVVNPIALSAQQRGESITTGESLNSLEEGPAVLSSRFTTERTL